MTRRLTIALVLAAMLPALVQLVGGVQMVGVLHSHDGSFAVAALRGFRGALAQGEWFPRWSLVGNGGLGSPIFFFYPPGAYWVAAAFGGMPEAAAIGCACFVFHAASIGGAALWLRGHVDRRAAWWGGAAYGLMPYVAIMDPQVRLAFAETAAAALFPLMFWAVDRGRGRVLATMAWLAPVTAALVFTHLPSTVMAGGLAGVYAVMLGSGWRDGVRRGAAAALGLALGLALAGVMLLPALGLRGVANFNRFNDAFFNPLNHFMFSTDSAAAFEGAGKALIWHVVALVPVAAAGFGILAPGAARLRVVRAALASLLLACFLLTPLSKPLWQYMPTLALLQFPFRFIQGISLLGAAVLALALPLMAPARRRLVAGGLLAMALAWSVASATRADWGHDYRSRTDAAMADLAHDVPEYFPTKAVSHFWDGYRHAGPPAVLAEGRALSGCAGHRGLPAVFRRGQIIMAVAGCSGVVTLPEFYFPGWVAAGGGAAGSGGAGSGSAAYADNATGLMLVNLPPGARQLVVERVKLPQEVRGMWLSLAAALIWALVALMELGRSHKRKRAA